MSGEKNNAETPALKAKLETRCTKQSAICHQEFLSRAMTASSNLIISVVPLCQWTVTLAGKPLWVKIASTMPPVKAAQFNVLFSLGTEM